jgi:hypothetical protein
MRGRKLKRNLKGGLRPPRGLKLPRQKLFEPVLETLSGIKVRSSYEKTCADLLYQNNIKFRYEPLMLLGGRRFRPDFYLPDYNLFIEICGYGHQPYYRDRIKYKEQIYKKNKLSAAFINYNGTGDLRDMIEEELRPFGVEFIKQ